MLTYILFVIGFLLLIFGADRLVEGAASIAKRYHISHIVIGMTIVALGTSAPELVVNLVAGLTDSADVALGNILGSNVANVFLILGVSALIFPLAVNNNTFYKEVPFAIMGAFLIGVLANDVLINGISQSVIYRSDGIVLVIFFVLFMYYAFSIARTNGASSADKIKIYSFFWSVVMVISGIIALVLGGHWIVQGAVEIAGQLGMSEAVISLTIVALGTSLPELATCVAAAIKKNVDIILGNVLGSNIFNIFFVMGTSAVIRPLPFNTALNFDIMVGIASMLLLWMFLVISGTKTLQRWQGVVFLIFYAAYIVVLFFRG